MGHGGMGVSDVYPINSLESIAHCINLDADGTEIDVQMTKDSVLIAFHDSELSPGTTLSGIVSEMTLAEITEARYINIPFTEYRVVTLKRIFTALEDYTDHIFTFDVKLYPGNNDLASYYDAYSDAIISFFEKYNLENSVYIESQSPEFLDIIHTKRPNYRLYYYPQNFEDGLTTVLNNDYDGISISNEFISTDDVARAHKHNVFVTIWGVRSKDENVDAIRKNPDMIQTDNVSYLVDLLK